MLVMYGSVASASHAELGVQVAQTLCGERQFPRMLRAEDIPQCRYRAGDQLAKGAVLQRPCARTLPDRVLDATEILWCPMPSERVHPSVQFRAIE